MSVRANQQGYAAMLELLVVLCIAVVLVVVIATQGSSRSESRPVEAITSPPSLGDTMPSFEYILSGDTDTVGSICAAFTFRGRRGLEEGSAEQIIATSSAWTHWFSKPRWYYTLFDVYGSVIGTALRPLDPSMVDHYQSPSDAVYVDPQDGYDVVASFSDIPVTARASKLVLTLRDWPARLLTNWELEVVQDAWPRATEFVSLSTECPT
jgi:hypothetical protein